MRAVIERIIESCGSTVTACPPIARKSRRISGTWPMPCPEGTTRPSGSASLMCRYLIRSFSSAQSRAGEKRALLSTISASLALNFSPAAVSAKPRTGSAITSS